MKKKELRNNVEALTLEVMRMQKELDRHTASLSELRYTLSKVLDLPEDRVFLL